MVRVMWSVAVICTMALVATVGAAGRASAQTPDHFGLTVIVASISDGEAKIDPRGKRLDAELRKKFRYDRLEVLEVRKFDLKVSEIGSLKLPDGKVFSVRPLNRGDRGLLMAVDWTDTMMMDMNAKNGHLLVIGGPQFKGGQLVIGVEPEYAD